MVAGFYAATCGRNMPPLSGRLLRRRAQLPMSRTRAHARRDARLDKELPGDGID